MTHNNSIVTSSDNAIFIAGNIIILDAQYYENQHSIVLHEWYKICIRRLR